MKLFMCVVVLAFGSSCSIRVHPDGAKDIMLDPEAIHVILDGAAAIDSAK